MKWSLPCSFTFISLLTLNLAEAQRAAESSVPTKDSMQQQVERLAAAVAQEEAELESSRTQILQLRSRVSELQAELAAHPNPTVAEPKLPEAGDDVARLKTEVDALREQQDLQQSEIAIHEQTKVESASKFPVKLTGLILMNGFANSAGVDVIQSPALAINGGGTAGLTLRQTVFGADARGPHLFGATSTADVRVDFFGGLNQGSYADAVGTARLRTAHAELNWPGTRAFFELDRPIVNPNAPTSLTAVAQPALAWSGNLWNWVPQAGVERDLWQKDSSRILIQGALADIPDPASQQGSLTALSAPSLAEQSRRPASEVRLGYSNGDKLTGLQIGAGGYVSPHSEGDDFHFDAWAATIDYRVPLPARFDVSGSLYRGAGLGGLGAGTFKDYILENEGEYYSVRPLDDVGGWTQLKARANERVEFNAAYGIDNAFAHELRGYVTSGSNSYQNLARNSTVFTNVIYSPTAYTLFSFEYRRIDSSPTVGPHSISDVYGVAAGYRF